MKKELIPYHQTGYFSQLILDYLDEKEPLKPFYNNSFSIDGFKKQIEEKQFSESSRKVLNDVLVEQYQSVDASSKTKENISLLLHHNTFTITTGHQLNLFTGPLYCLYKIVSVINISKELKKIYSDKNFVPVFWMASEDHDFEEVNHFNLFDVRHEISTTQNGAVGRMKIESIEKVFTQLEKTLNGRTGLEEIISKLKECYQEGRTFAEATRELINHLFGEYGLVVIDGDDSNLKAQFVPFVKSELLNQTNHKIINETSVKLVKLGYKKQVNPREINVFYLSDNLRERIVFEDDFYKVLNTEISCNESELLDELNNHPERYSPNAVMRPLYQETVLPNLAYIGGGGELAYWFQLKEMFEYNKVNFPILALRNSVLIVDGGTQRKMEKFNLKVEDLFVETNVLINSYVKSEATVNLELNKEKDELEYVFKEVVLKADKVDSSLKGMIEAELQKSLKALKNIEGRLIKAEKQKEEVSINQISAIKNKLFPSNSLQERKDNLIYAYMLLQKELIPSLIEHLDPFETEFTILEA